MTDSVFYFLFLLILKHTVCDYFLQTVYHIKNKGIYLAAGGLIHSGHHAVGTLLCSFAVTSSCYVSLLIAAIDFGCHYHIDYVKTRFGPKDINHPYFWRWFGIDQTAHMLTYLFLSTII